ncbi:hypothetical protein WMF31_15525 [Sorangium sp. So ce1036]|uniref:hypothetical protein n=1 Tax=Sorangium sp. So ce1036 TaxID=3133328 RepID=UPI003EFE68C3
MSGNAAELATLAETMRQEGNYSGAIAHFDAATTKNPEYWWAYAHRGAARAALGDFDGAHDDLFNKDVIAFYRERNWRWLCAQQGELYRLWAMASTSTLEESNARSSHNLLRSGLAVAPWHQLTSKAIALFTKALECTSPDCPEPRCSACESHKTKRIKNNNPWMLAHRGATYAMRCWIMNDLLSTLEIHDTHTTKTFKSDHRNAIDDLSAAAQCNPTYGWAYLFLAVIHSIPDELPDRSNNTLNQHHNSMPLSHDKSLQYIGKAQLSGLNRDLTMVRLMMELSIYTGGQSARLLRQRTAHADHVAKHEAVQTLREGVRYAWQALQMENDDTLARYFVANGLHELAELDNINLEISENPTLKAALKRARVAVEGMKARCQAMSGGLDCMEKNWESARRTLNEIRESKDLQAITIVRRDPAWARLPPEDKERIKGET